MSAPTGGQPGSGREPRLADPPRLVDPRTYLRADLDGAELFSFLGGSAAVASGRNPLKATCNEDAAALVPFDDACGVLVVADGAGGTPAGEEAARITVETVIEGVRAVDAVEGSLRSAILDAIERANEQVLALGTGSATTVSVVEVQGSTVRSYHVGDSPILITGQRGRIKQQTVAHSPVGYAIESGLLDEDEAVDHEERHIVSNLVGSRDMRIELGPTVELAPRDTLVLASDGLSDNLYVSEIVETVRKGPLPRVMRGLLSDCRRRMTAPRDGEPSHADDLTLVVFRRAAPPPKRRTRAADGAAAGSTEAVVEEPASGSPEV